VIDAYPPFWPPQALPYVTSVSTSAVTAQKTFSEYVKNGSGSSLLSPEEQRLAALESLKADWDSRGGPPPAQGSVSAARQWLQPLRVAAELSGSEWHSPHMSVSEMGEVTLEWWHQNRKITLYFGEGVAAPEYVRVWGPHIFDQMESGKLFSSDSFSEMWSWLNAA
jgi:hypothetical protein